MTIIIRNGSNAQARRAFERIRSQFTGWTWTSDTRIDNGVVSVDRLTAAVAEREAELIAANSYPDEAPVEAFDVTIQTNYFTCATILGALTPAMRERAIMRDGEPAEAYCERANAHNN